VALPRRIRIDEDGRLTSEEGELREFLELFSGSWRIESVGRDLLVLVPESEAPENAGTTMLSGRIAREGRLVDIIGFVSSSRWSGTLTVHSGRTRRQLFFDKGALRMASSSEASDRLGELMHRLGMITRNQLEEAVEGL